MASLFTTKKRLLTLYVNKIEHILNNLKGEKLEDTPLNPNLPQDALAENIHGLEEGISVLESSMEKVEKALHELASMGDNPDITGKEKEIEDYTTNSETILIAAFDYLLMLQARLRALKSSIPSLTPTPRESNSAVPIGQAKVKTLELPPIPIPTFGGNIWEWDSFWSIFNTNIHSQDVTDMVKFNYLLNSLKGEVKNSIRKFQLTGENYRKAIQFLHNKYGNREALINALVEKLDNCSLHGQSINDQRRLLEELQVITTQLEEKGEEVNSSWLIKKILCKFPDSLKRKVIAKKQGIASTTPFTMSMLYQLIDEAISTEELLLTFTEPRPKVAVNDNITSRQKLRVKRPMKGVCMFCGDTHSSHNCNKYSTPQERSTYLRRNNLCLICASPAHNTNQCKGRKCFRCNGPHHTSCCFKGNPNHPSKPPETQRDSGHPITSSSKKTSGPNNKGNKSTKVKSHVIITPENNSYPVTPSVDTSGETVMLQHHTVPNKTLLRHPYLPIGKVTIVDPTTQALTQVSVLLDTGAELSFIDSSLAERLQLPILETKVVQLMTFGSNDVKKTTCNRVCLKVWDAEGNPHELDLFTHNILTRSLETPSLPDTDVEFIHSLNLPIMWEPDQRKVTPSILLGCDQLWLFMRANQPSIPLPSGMHVLPTTLGYLISGRPQSQGERVLQVSHPIPENTDQWMNLWAMDVVQQYAIHSEESEVSQEEKDKWEKFWTLEAAGTEEFTGTEKEARAEQDTRVWERFNNTIQRRPDGYYVRLPWIEQYPYLPDNKALAYRRLVNVWASISKDQTLLEQYDSVFRDQLQQNIIEPVEDSSCGTTGQQVHYIPHQPVITPHKATTKLRIVFDASAHYKNCPSLNDVLYRGPVILPLIYGILLRFRVGKIAVISDIEKAFLQVRLQEQDRDATRCFWLRDYKSPPSFNNTVTFRFTRVTFGLKSSPFLLAAAILYHLNTYHTEDDLIRDIRKNMYVDNLVLTTDTLEEAVHVYRRTKQMFQEINMNLREFSSNDHLLVYAIDEKDRAIETHPKVLGLLWNVNSDTILASCHFPDTQYVTKRTITSAIASIYDPLGWILPLLHRAKVFLRELWKEQYTWDQELPMDKENEWVNITEVVEGFEKQIPRYCAPKETETILVTFADASSSCMAACTYLCHDNTSFLVMAKSKLPSLQVKYTIPKLELNAMTLAMRLCNSVFTELRDTLNIREVYIFSDSQIVLGWLKKKPEREVGPFVYRRLVEIHNIAHHITTQRCPVRIGYIASQENPADCATRGTTKEELQDHVWWEGPHFLRYSPLQWPGQADIFQYPLDDPEAFSPDTIRESEGILTITTRRDNNVELLHPTQVQTWTQAKRIIAYALRFLRILVKRINSKGDKFLTLSAITGQYHPYKIGYLTAAEVRTAELVLLRHHQTVHVTQQLITSLQQLNIHIDEQGIFRCYGRLGNARLDNNTKNPVLVIQKTLLADIIIRDVHQQGHPGVNHTIAMVRQEFWIPQLRSQVCAMIRKCFQCQKFNNLPYRYPAQEDLPKERVIRSHPFQHVGLDYFGPLTIKSAIEGHAKCYGAIITCKTTRLIHIDVVADMTTRAFLNMLRRFFARRGIPQSITSDNAPTFELGETILKECLHAAQNDPNISRELSNKEIEWNYNTPFAPWQGGFYERLIKSIKQCLYKTIGRSILSLEELATTLIEIEALLNTRPLTYVTGEPHKDLILRPIDFLQKEIHVSFPLEKAFEDVEDPEYLPSAELAVLQTKKEAVKALESSCKLTEKFWKAWQTEYLTALREKHTLNIGRKRGCLQYPKEGTVVLINDPVLPRHSWKMGMIHQVVPNARGTVREVVIRLPSQRLIRRPINLVTPLELEEQGTEQVEPSSNSQREEAESSAPVSPQPQYEAAHEQQEAAPRYNLRKRRPTNYAEDIDELGAFGQGPSRNMFMISTFMQLSIIHLLALTLTEANLVAKVQSLRSMICIPGGVRLTSEYRNAYEICADQYCVHVEEPQYSENISFPPEIILHEHSVQWKFTDNETVGTMEMTCPPGPFCQSISCTFCSANILNPECWPKSAILATTIMLYCLITGCYVFLYVPIVLGHPVRFAGRIAWAIIKWAIRGFLSVKGRPRNFPRRRLVEIIAISTTVLNIGLSHQCQEVNLFTHHSIICAGGPDSSCRVQLSEVFKINPFKREACLRLSQNDTVVHEVRMRWKSLLLSCEPVTDLFTRDTVHKVIDSKRCPHSGSCTGEKCADINASSLLPELAQGNQYPGNTACVESCGGPGCDCFFLSSGCLFYRIYLEPVSNEVFEIFHCNRWTEAAKVELTHFDDAIGEPTLTTKLLLPNVPVQWKAFTITLTNIGSPPIPLLNTQFITNGKSTALWKNNIIPPLRCANFSNAEILACDVFEDCTCWPAEMTANCKCRDLPITAWLSKINNLLPATFPSISLRMHPQSKVQAAVTSMVTSEIILSFQGTLRTEILVEDAICTVTTEELKGCYSCSKGSSAKVLCKASRNKVRAEVVCDSVAFSIPCNITGIASVLRFSFSQARNNLHCSVSCGQLSTSFEISGVLKFTASAQGIVEQWLRGESISNSESPWPDLRHIASVFLQWYKTLAAAMAGLIITIALTYLFLLTCGSKILGWILRTTVKVVNTIIKSTLIGIKKTLCIRPRRHSKQH